MDQPGSTLCVLPTGDPSMTISSLQQAITTICSSKASCDTKVNLVVDESFFPGVFSQGLHEFPQSWEYEDLAASYGAKPVSTVVEGNSVQLEIAPGDAPGINNFKIRTLRSPVNLPVECVHCITTTNDTALPIVNAYYEVASSTTGSYSLKLIGRLRYNSSPVTISVSIGQPASFYGQLLKYFLESHGAQVTLSSGKCAATAPTSRQLPIHIIKSQPLSTLMNHTLQVSDNLYTELFIRQLAMRLTTPSGLSDPFVDLTAIGTNLVKSILYSVLHTDNSSFVQKDASGVSVQNLVSPLALVKVFQNFYVLEPKIAPIFRSMLPVAGMSGTLINRFTNYKGILEAKTGSLSGVNSLSGYVHNKLFPDETLVFSILVNHSMEPASVVRQTIDDIALALSFTDPAC